MESYASVSIARPARYAKQLANHLSHKIESSPTNTGWDLVFSQGTASIVVTDHSINFFTSAATAENTAFIQDVMARHLRKFAAKEGDLIIDWVQK
jgi:hypothetical protein